MKRSPGSPAGPRRARSCAVVVANALTVVAGVGAVSIGGFGVLVVVIVVDQLQ